VRRIPSKRKRVQPDEPVPIKLTRAERALILDKTFAEDDLTNRLRLEPTPGASPIYRYTLADFDHLGGHIAAAANHAPDKKLKKQLDALFDRIYSILREFTDGD
jgi:hypothetical protein